MASKNQLNLIKALLQSPIAFHRVFVDLAEGALPGLFLSQAWYWSGKTQDVEGWFYKTQVEWEEETGITRKEQETARKHLRRASLLEEKLRGQPARLWYRLNLEILQTRLYEMGKLDCPKRANKIAPNGQTTRAKTGASNLRNSESSSETTTETTFRDLKPPKPPQTRPTVARTYAEISEHLGNGLSQGESCKDAAKPAKKPPTKMATWDADPLPGSPVALGKRFQRDYTPGFLAWWGAYPADRRISKPECFAVWRHQSLEERTDELCKKLGRLKETTWKYCERKYIKTSLPYLNSGRYEDDLVPFPAIPVREDTGLDEKGYHSALASMKIMEDTRRDEQQRSAALLSASQHHDTDIPG